MNHQMLPTSMGALNKLVIKKKKWKLPRFCTLALISVASVYFRVKQHDTWRHYCRRPLKNSKKNFCNTDLTTNLYMDQVWSVLILEARTCWAQGLLIRHVIVLFSYFCQAKILQCLIQKNI